MKNTSLTNKQLRTSIADLENEITDEQLGQVAGGFFNGGQGWPTTGTTTEQQNKCWQASTSATAPGTPDTAQDYVND